MTTKFATGYDDLKRLLQIFCQKEGLELQEEHLKYTEVDYLRGDTFVILNLDYAFAKGER